MQALCATSVGGKRRAPDRGRGPSGAYSSSACFLTISARRFLSRSKRFMSVRAWTCSPPAERISAVSSHEKPRSSRSASSDWSSGERA